MDDAHMKNLMAAVLVANMRGTQENPSVLENLTRLQTFESSNPSDEHNRTRQQHAIKTTRERLDEQLEMIYRLVNKMVSVERGTATAARD